jgi:hypothetical protein
LSSPPFQRYRDNQPSNRLSADDRYYAGFRTWSYLIRNTGLRTHHLKIRSRASTVRIRDWGFEPEGLQNLNQEREDSKLNFNIQPRSTRSETGTARSRSKSTRFETWTEHTFLIRNKQFYCFNSLLMLG